MMIYNDFYDINVWLIIIYVHLNVSFNDKVSKDFCS